MPNDARPTVHHYSRLLRAPSGQSFFLFGPRGTGKTTWIKEAFPNSAYIDLLDDEIFNRLLAQPKELEFYIQMHQRKLFIVIDEIQKVPRLLDEVHRLIEGKKYKFVLTGSNPRKLKKSGANLLAGRALAYEMFPLSAHELKEDFVLKAALSRGTLPMSLAATDPKKYLNTYVKVYLKEEIELEGLTRNIQGFSRFLQIASFSQGSPLVISNIASEVAINRKVVEDYFSILRDLLVSVELPVFSRRSKRELISKRKFYFFDVGVFRALRPLGPLDSEAELNGLALETLVLNELRILNSGFDLDFEIFYWRTRDHLEVDFILYGPKGLLAFEVKSAARIDSAGLVAMKEFAKDYPSAKLYVIYGGRENKTIENIHFITADYFFKNAILLLSKDHELTN